VAGDSDRMRVDLCPHNLFHRARRGQSQREYLFPESRRLLQGSDHLRQIYASGIRLSEVFTCIGLPELQEKEYCRVVDNKHHAGFHRRSFLHNAGCDSGCGTSQITLLWWRLQHRQVDAGYHVDNLRYHFHDLALRPVPTL